MPRSVWTQEELEKAVVLRYNGHSPTQIAKILTTENLKRLMLEKEIFYALDKINQERKRDTRMKTLLPQMLQAIRDLGYKTTVFDGEVLQSFDVLLRDNIVMAHRLQAMEKTQRWETYYNAYAQSEVKKWRSKVRRVLESG